MKIVEVEILLQKYLQARRGKWMLEPICKNADDKTVDFLIETAIGDFHAAPDKTLPSTAAIVENLGLSGKKAAAVFLHSILQNEEFKRYHAAAKRGKQNFSAVSGFTASDIADLSIPDFDLSAACQKNFDYEGRIITLGVADDLTLSITDEVDKVCDKLDFVGSRILTRFIHEMGDVLDFAAARFSDAIVTGRRWRYGAFLRCVTAHPILNKFAQNLIWAAYDGENRLKKIVRYTGGGFLDLQDRPVEFYEDGIVGILNPMDVDHGMLTALQAKYRTALNQLGRGVYRVEERERGQTAVTRFSSYLIDYVRFIEGLGAKGYEQGNRENKVSRVLYRVNAALGLAAKIVYAAPDNKRHLKNTRVQKILFYRLETLKKKNGKWSGDRIPPLPLETVDKYFFSDVLGELYELL